MPEPISIHALRGKFSQHIATVTDEKAKTAAVQILVLENHGLEIVLTKRSAFVQNHKNEISFPGGAAEKSDGNLYSTALRETCEEINICENSIQFLGSLEPFTTHYGLMIYPFIGSIPVLELEQARPNREVEAIFTIPLKWFMEKTNYELRDIKVAGGTRHQVIFYKPYQNYVVWGITASILQKFIYIITN